MTSDEFIPENRMRSCVHFVSERSGYCARPVIELLRGQPYDGLDRWRFGLAAELI